LGKKSTKVIFYATRDMKSDGHVDIWEIQPILHEDDMRWYGPEVWMTPVQGVQAGHFKRIFKYLPIPGEEVMEITSYYRKKENKND